VKVVRWFRLRLLHRPVGSRLRTPLTTALRAGMFAASSYISFPHRNDFPWIRRHHASWLPGQATLMLAVARSAYVVLYKRASRLAVRSPARIA